MLTDYRRIFPKRHTFLVVIHCVSLEQALRNIAIALENGADGVFLINHAISAQELIDIYAEARKRHPGAWIGLNILPLDCFGAYDIMSDADGLWVDDAGIRNSGDCSEAEAFMDHVAGGNSGWLYFGGVAFKYQELITDPGRAARLGAKYMDVVTTSGDGTGSPPSVDKVMVMKEAIGDHPLAIASGTAPENLHPYFPYADCLIAATSISEPQENPGSEQKLIPKRVRLFADVLEEANR